MATVNRKKQALFTKYFWLDIKTQDYYISKQVAKAYVASSSLAFMTAIRDFINCFNKSPLGMVYLTLSRGGSKN